MVREGATPPSHRAKKVQSARIAAARPARPSSHPERPRRKRRSRRPGFLPSCVTPMRAASVAQPLRQHPRLVLEQDLDLSWIDDASYNAVAELRMPNEITFGEGFADAVRLELANAFS